MLEVDGGPGGGAGALLVFLVGERLLALPEGVGVCAAREAQGVPEGGGEVGGGLAQIEELDELGVDVRVPVGLALDEVVVEIDALFAQGLEPGDLVDQLRVDCWGDGLLVLWLRRWVVLWLWRGWK